MSFLPTCGYRTTLSQGDVGHDCAALQLNLNAWRDTQTGLEDALVLDGSYGGRTYRRARTFQRRRGLWVDGVFGPVSNRALAIEFLEPAAETFDLPDGMLKGQTRHESTFAVGAVNCQVAGSKDIGWTQRRVKDDSAEATYRDAFDGPKAFARAASELRSRKDSYYNAAEEMFRLHEYMWKAAIGAHNWPSAAARVAAGTFDEWRYTSDGKTYGVDDKAPWVIAIGVPNVETGRQWWNHYVSKVAVYIQEWTP